MMKPETDGPVIFFDGVCNLCNGLVQFIIKRDTKARLRFSSLQSDYACRTIPARYRDGHNPDTIVVLKGSVLLERSDAVLEIAHHLRGGWPLLNVLRIVPRFIRDGMYNFIAHHRYRWFGKRDACMIPTPELSSRFMS